MSFELTRYRTTWQDELRKECYWQNELSFDSLKSQKLIQNHYEWKSIYTAFKYKFVSSTQIKQWLINQKGHFRTSYLSHLLIIGYCRISKILLFNVNIVPKEVQDIILFYANLTFIKVYTKSDAADDDYTIYTFDCNFTINNLTTILNRILGRNDFSNFNLRLWTRFHLVKFIYSVQKNGHKTYRHPHHYDDNKRWVQIPHDFGKQLKLKEMDDKLEYYQILEFGVDRLRKIHFDRGLSAQKWTFKENEENKTANENELNFNHFEWLCSLKVGDSIDVNVCYQWMKGFIFGRDYDTFYVHLENGNRFSVYKDIQIKSIGIINLQRLQRSDTRCKGNKSFCDRIDGNLVHCDWMTDFNTSSHFVSYPILFE